MYEYRKHFGKKKSELELDGEKVGLMTPRQKEIFLVIDEWWIKYGFGPSIDDIMFITGDKSRGNVHRIIECLCRIGACKKVKDRARSVRPTYVRFKNLE